MEPEAFRGAIYHFHIKGLAPKEIKEELDSVHRDSAPSYDIVKYWVKQFKCGRTSVSNEAPPGRPKTVLTEETIQKVHEMIMDDRRVKLQEIADELRISKERVHHIVHEELDFTKRSARWVPRLLTPDMKLMRLRASKAGLERIQHNPKDFWRRIVTVDETWIHYYTPESKEQSKQWMRKGEKAPVKAKTTKSAEKVMATVFWDCQGILLVDYLEKGKSITGLYYAGLLHNLNDEICNNRRGIEKKKVLFLQDNASPHKAAVSMAKLHELRYEIIEHAPYSPDLSPCDFFLFPQLKKNLAGRRFESNEEVIAAVKDFFDTQDKSFYSEGMKKLEDRWMKCVELRGDYVEK